MRGLSFYAHAVGTAAFPGLVLADGLGFSAPLATFALGPRWLARGFDPGSARAMGLRSELPDAILLVLVAFAVVSSLTAIGALLATALFVVPAATTRLWTARLITWQLSSVAL